MCILIVALEPFYLLTDYYQLKITVIVATNSNNKNQTKINHGATTDTVDD